MKVFPSLELLQIIFVKFLIKCIIIINCERKISSIFYSYQLYVISRNKKLNLFMVPDHLRFAYQRDLNNSKYLFLQIIHIDYWNLGSDFYFLFLWFQSSLVVKKYDLSQGRWNMLCTTITLIVKPIKVTTHERLGNIIFCCWSMQRFFYFYFLASNENLCNEIIL